MDRDFVNYTLVLFFIGAFGTWGISTYREMTQLAPGAHKEAAKRPEHWAERIHKRGLPNLHRVSKELYRGGQPQKGGLAQLEELGIRTVVNLRTHPADQVLADGTRLDVIDLPWNAHHPPKDEDVASFLRIVSTRGPVFVHCRRGADRTGVMCAMYRIIMQSWTPEEAIDEMVRGGYQFTKSWRHLIDYVRGADVVRIKTLVSSGRHRAAANP